LIQKTLFGDSETEGESGIIVGHCTSKHDFFSSVDEVRKVERNSALDGGQLLNTKLHVTAAGSHVSYF